MWENKDWRWTWGYKTTFFIILYHLSPGKGAKIHFSRLFGFSISPGGNWNISSKTRSRGMNNTLFIIFSCQILVSLQVRIQDLVKGGAPASEAESCRHSEAESRERSEHSAAGVQGPLKGPGSFWVFDAQICILTHSRDSFSLIFDIYFDTKSW